MGSKLFPKKWKFQWKIVFFFFPMAILLQVGLLWISDSKVVKRGVKQPSRQPSSFIVMQPITTAFSKNAFALLDPTIYLLPSELGFSSGLHKLSVNSKMTVEETAPPVVKLEASVSPKSGNFEPLTMTHPIFEKNDLPDLGLSTPPVNSLVEGSAWSVTGAVSERSPAHNSALPVVVSPDSLAPTLLRVGVTPQGDVQFVLLEKSSGSEKADEAGVRFAEGIRFGSVESNAEEEVSWGFVKILWRPEPVAPKP